MDRKRPLEDGTASASKKAKISATSKASAQTALIEQKRKEIAAKLAAMKGSGTLPSSVSSSVVAPKPSPSPAMSDDIARKIAEAKKKVQSAHSKFAASAKSSPHTSGPPSRTSSARPPEPMSASGSGLKMAAHPLLLDTTPSQPQSKKDRYKPMQPKFASIKANSRNAPAPAPMPIPVPIVEAANPYLTKEAVDGNVPKERVGRSFRFNPKGKYVAIADQARQDAKMEALKQRIADQARKAGLDSEMGIEKTIKRPAPPQYEWWDEALLPNKSYNDLDMGVENLNFTATDSPITIYVQHPIPIPAPGDKTKELKPLMLTSREQKKMRKLRRAGELQDKRDRIRMGLLPPDPPKVRLQNLMRVLTSDAIQDPTRVEARVRREVAMRRHNHEKMNSERKLTDDQRKEKLEAKKADEEKRGIQGAVFKIKTLTDPSHRFKVRKNAEQMNLTGLCIFGPHFSMVYVEGATKFIRQYKKLMLNRIAWTEASRPRGGEEVELVEGAPEVAPAEPVSLEDNRCWLVWEGELRDRAFGNFRPRSCETDRSAKELLGEKLRGYWDQAKNWKGEEEELF
ncbi:PRP3-domain-containing protein [Cylindrobasidium torrendii FP15055 ss-10]|uniref:PRP3-domain-containing protein n=1 Tax=Cylindrobasidium torrendii FP15055 ss-10 TaxID=1314674 RepID=A0A0D7B9T4_9AGAR|nr:PRP3-domain-containing protein [Cylindrobasidium torrendii FP15055 ss-10]